MTRSLEKSLALLLFLVFLLPNIYVTIWPLEDWPFTNAPMFAHYVDQDTPRYRFKLEAVGVETKELGYYSVGANWSLWRYFFKHVYSAGNAEIEKFLNNYFAEFKARHPSSARNVKELRLSLAQLSWQDNSDAETRLLITYPVEGK